MEIDELEGYNKNVIRNNGSMNAAAIGKIYFIR
jgi:hypothetical protein